MGIFRKISDAVKGQKQVAVQETQGQMFVNALCSNAENVFAQMRPLVDELKMVQPYGVGRNGAKLAPARTRELLALQAPNEDMGWAEFSDLMFTTWLTEKELNIHVWKNQRGKVLGYSVLPPNSRIKVGNEVRFRVTLADGTMAEYGRDEVMTLRFSRNPRSMDNGISPGVASMVWAQIDDVIAQYQLAHFENGAVPAYVTIIRASTKEKYLEKRREMEQGFHGAKNKGKTLFLWRQFLDDGTERDEVEVKTIQGSNASLAIKEIMAIVNDKLNKAFGVSNFILGDDSSAKYDNAELSQQQFLSHRVYPALYTFWSQFQHELERVVGGLPYAISWDLEIPELTDRLKVKAETKKVEAETANLRVTREKLEEEKKKTVEERNKVVEEKKQVQSATNHQHLDAIIAALQAGATPEAIVTALGLDESWLELARTMSGGSTGDNPDASGQNPDSPTSDDEGSTGQNPDNPTKSGDLSSTDQVACNHSSTSIEGQGWIGATTEKIDVTTRLSQKLKEQLYSGDLAGETTNIPAQENPHFTVFYGLTEKGFKTPDIDIQEVLQENLPSTVEVNKITVFDNDDQYKVIVAELDKTDELQRLYDVFLGLDHYELEFPTYKPHITLCYVDKEVETKPFLDAFKELIGKQVSVTGFQIDNPWRERLESYQCTRDEVHDHHDHQCACCHHSEDGFEPKFSVEEVVEQQIYLELLKVVESAMHEVLGKGVVLSQDDLEKLTQTIVSHLVAEADDGANTGAEEIRGIVLGATGDEIAGVLENGGYHLSDDFYNNLSERTEDLISRLSDEAKEKATEVLNNPAAPKSAAELEQALAEVMPRARAATIARNETVYAFRAGHLENDEYIAKKYNLKMKKVWRCHDGACEICKALDGKEVALSEAFPDSVTDSEGTVYSWTRDKWNLGGLITSAHVLCRCYFETIVEGYND